jgi:putative heme-binding domain-containing protein
MKRHRENRRARRLAGGAVLWLASVAIAADSDLEIGRRSYEARCAHCHGAEGEGGRGSVLRTGRFRHAQSDRDLFRIIRGGIPGTEMPGLRDLPAKEIRPLVAYVRQLARGGAADEPATGNAVLGEFVYEQEGCAACHSIKGRGGISAPDLTAIGMRRAVPYLRRSIVEPSDDVPLEYRAVVVSTRSGKTVAGIHLNEDEYSIHVQDMEGELHSFLKRELAKVELPDRSTMPRYDALSKTDLENLVAYLASLRPPQAK